MLRSGVHQCFHFLDPLSILLVSFQGFLFVLFFFRFGLADNSFFIQMSVRQHSLWLWFHISLTVSDTEHFSCKQHICVSCLGKKKCLFKSFAHFSVRCFLLVCRSSLVYILDIDPLLALWFVNVFSHAIGCLFTLVDCVLWCLEFKFYCVSFIIFFLCCLCFWVMHPRNYCQIHPLPLLLMNDFATFFTEKLCSSSRPQSFLSLSERGVSSIHCRPLPGGKEQMLTAKEERLLTKEEVVSRSAGLAGSLALGL